jgi:hypothetical protein
MKNPYRDMAERWDAAAARRNLDSDTPAPRVPKPLPTHPMTTAETAAFIVAAGRWARGEAAAPEYVPQNERHHRREDDQPEDDQPGDIVLRIVEQQRKEREGK